MALLTRLWLILAVALVLPVAAAAKSPDVQTTWRLLDYIAVDYPGAVSGGKIVSTSEYAEMREFSASVAEQMSALPAKPDKARLIADTRRLRAAIDGKSQPAEVARLARGIGANLLRAYPVAMGPPGVPDLARGAQLYRETCAACHGATGDAKTAMAAKLDPPPIAFADRERAAERTPFALYQVIDQGLEGTAMVSFASLPNEGKWALAFHVSRLAYPAALAAKGKAIWDGDPSLRAQIADLATLSGTSEKALAERIGADRAGAVIAYLRANPGAVTASSADGASSTLAIARQRLKESLAAYQASDRDRAKALALSAYLDGFEPIEPMLSARDPALMASVEQAMAQLRAAIASGRPVEEVRDRVEALDSLFADTEQALAPSEAGAASAFVGALTILVREGLEALLIIVAMLSFLSKAERPEMVRTVHYGWITALIAGVGTWWAATNLLTISGASRELTEGLGSILAALILLFVGIWMHGKAQANEWQRYIKAKLGAALSKRSAWFLFLLAFIAVYREVFETILFFAAMSAEGNVGALIAGGAAGLLILAAIAIAMFRFSARLPIAKFFAYSSALIAVLAVVLAGKGVAALQEAGLLGVTPIAGAPRIEILGLYPTLEGLAAQVATLVILLLGFAWNRRESRKLAVA